MPPRWQKVVTRLGTGGQRRQPMPRPAIESGTRLIASRPNLSRDTRSRTIEVGAIRRAPSVAALHQHGEGVPWRKLAKKTCGSLKTALRGRVDRSWPTVYH